MMILKTIHVCATMTQHCRDDAACITFATKISRQDREIHIRIRQEGGAVVLNAAEVAAWCMQWLVMMRKKKKIGWVKVRWSERLTRPVIREPITYESVYTFQCTGALVNHDLKINAGMLHVRPLCLERCDRSGAMVP